MIKRGHIRGSVGEPYPDTTTIDNTLLTRTLINAPVNEEALRGISPRYKNPKKIEVECL
jgi:hypothetical protein